MRSFHKLGSIDIASLTSETCNPATECASLDCFLRPRQRAGKHDFDEGARARPGLDVELRAVGLDQGLGQRKVDRRTVGRLLRQWEAAKRLQGRCEFVAVEPGARIADPQYHVAQIRQRSGNEDLATGI